MNKVTHVKSLCKTLGSAAVISALFSCGGSGGGTPERQALKANDPVIGKGLTADDVAVGGELSMSLKGIVDSSAAHDLSLANSSATVLSSGNISFMFDVSESGGAVIPMDMLSVALEVAATGTFSDSYRMPLYDLREEGAAADGGISVSARSAPLELPDGTYIARLVVNPNWQYAFDVVPNGGNDAQPFRYLAERDFSNNAGNTFQITVSNNIECSEDEYEDNDGIGTAAVIPQGGQVSASLCLDDSDFYSFILADGETTSLTFDYTDSRSNPNPATRYVVLDSSFNRVTQPAVARESNRIVIEAENAGQYYLALYGQRSSYRITRAGGPAMPDDYSNENIFHSQTMLGPNSWAYGQIELNRLAFTDLMLNDQVVNCGRISTQYRDEWPVAYVTPQHFADIHEFRFLPGGGYIVDGERHNGWRVQDGDISNIDWYENDYPGYAEKVADNTWRYWSADGLGFTECTLEVNQ